jgi:hypothetical protein
MNEGKQRDGNMGGSDGFSWCAGIRRVFGMECLGWCSKFQEAVERARRRSSVAISPPVTPQN